MCNERGPESPVQASRMAKGQRRACSLLVLARCCCPLFDPGCLWGLLRPEAVRSAGSLESGHVCACTAVQAAGAIRLLNEARRVAEVLVTLPALWCKACSLKVGSATDWPELPAILLDPVYRHPCARRTWSFDGFAGIGARQSIEAGSAATKRPDQGPLGLTLTSLLGQQWCKAVQKHSGKRCHRYFPGWSSQLTNQAVHQISFTPTVE